jgi:uncharacterized membrane protein
VIQTLWFEALGIVIFSPLLARYAGTGTIESVVVLLALSLAMMAWSAVYNTVFDAIEHDLTGRVASNRPHALRCVHTILYEATGTLVTCPLIVVLTHMSWSEALLADIGATAAYAGYGYLFHVGFDALRPVAPAFGGWQRPRSSHHVNSSSTRVIRVPARTRCAERMGFAPRLPRIRHSPIAVVR